MVGHAGALRFALVMAFDLSRASDAVFMNSRDAPEYMLASGAEAPLTEVGYQLVSTLKSDAEMDAYVRRLLAADGMGVKEGMEQQISGFLPYYSGTNGTQSLQQLRDEIRASPWAVHISSLEVDDALGKLKSERFSEFSNASAYAMMVANVLTEGGGAAPRVVVEEDLAAESLTTISQELQDSTDSLAKIVFQKQDGTVHVMEAAEVALELVMSPVKKLACALAQGE